MHCNRKINFWGDREWRMQWYGRVTVRVPYLLREIIGKSCSALRRGDELILEVVQAGGVGAEVCPNLSGVGPLLHRATMKVVMKALRNEEFFYLGAPTF